MDYLLNCQPFLKDNDLSGWKTTFAPAATAVEPPKKRRRMSPNAIEYQPMPPCRGCSSPETIEDVKEGCVVCTACGMIQSLHSLGAIAGVANMSADRMMNASRHVVHRYSRVVYFRSFLLGLQGLTYPQISGQQQASLQAMLDGEGSATPSSVLKCLKKMNLSKKFRRHKEALAVRCSRGVYEPVSIPGDVFFKLLTLFRRVEFFWDHGCKQHMPGRRVFMSYPYVYFQLCHHLGVPSLSGAHHLLQSRKLQALLHKSYGRLAKKAKITCDLNAYR